MPFPILPSNSATGYFLTKSLRFRASVGAYLSRTFGSATSTTTGTFSFWMKRGKLSNNYQYIWSASNYDLAYFDSNDYLWIAYLGNLGYVNTNAVYRDSSAWYHIMIVFDTTNATAANRLQVYVNGVSQSLNWGSTPQTQNATFQRWNVSGYTGDIGDFQFNHTNPFDGYFAEYYWIDGQALTPSSFGSTNSLTGVWQPIKYTGTYGNNGFYLPFTDIALTSGSNAGLGKDFSGNANYWNTNNISVTAGITYDSMTDVPTLTNATTANYCVLNPLDAYTNVTLSNANLSATFSAYTGFVRGTMALPSTGQWYWEGTAPTSDVRAEFGIATFSQSLAVDPQSAAGCWTWYSNGTNSYKYNSGTQTSWGTAWVSGDIIGIAFDAGAGTLTYYKNGSLQGGGAAFTGLTGTYAPMLGFGNNSSTAISMNFGQQGFAYTPPTGFVALNTYNLPTSTIVKGNTSMDAILYTGNGVFTTRTGLSLSTAPGLVWIKSRSATTDNIVEDSVTGTSYLRYTNSTVVDGITGGGWIQNLATTGFSTDVNLPINTNGATYVGWTWAGGGSSSSNTSGSITSTVSVNATAGFSVVTYTGNSTGATVGHGLGVSPGMIIIKNRASASNWRVWQKSFSSLTQGYLSLNSTNAINTDATIWNNTAPTSSVFSVGNDSSVNTSPNTYVAYCWAEIAGFSKFGSYVGNGNSNGPFVYTGFRPKFILTKRSSTAGAWHIYDTSRSTYNLASVYLVPNASDAEYSGDNQMDILSNGFKLRSSNTGTNENGTTIIYAAFAENPFKNALAR